MFLKYKWCKIFILPIYRRIRGRGVHFWNQFRALYVDATLEFFMTARGVILLVFYSYRVFPFEMETFDLEMMTSNFPIYICGSIVCMYVWFLGK